MFKKKRERELII